MMNKIYTITASLFFLVFSVVGQTLGVLGGEFLYWMYENVMQLNMPSVSLLIAPHIISGIVGGWLSALVCSKVYSSYHPVFILIIPTLFILIYTFGFLITLVNGDVSFTTGMPIVTNILTLYFFSSSLKNMYPSSGGRKDDEE